MRMIADGVRPKGPITPVTGTEQEMPAFTTGVITITDITGRTIITGIIIPVTGTMARVLNR